VIKEVRQFGFRLGLRKLAAERSFFNPRLPFMQPPGERWEALFDQYHTSLRNAGLAGLAGGALGFLAAAKLFKGNPFLSGMVGLPIGALGGFTGAGHLTYESMRDTIPPTQQELKERDPLYRAKQIANYVRYMNRSFGQ
jgi:hypothetical protein